MHGLQVTFRRPWPKFLFKRRIEATPSLFPPPDTAGIEEEFDGAAVCAAAADAAQLGVAWLLEAALREPGGALLTQRPDELLHEVAFGPETVDYNNFAAEMSDIMRNWMGPEAEAEAEAGVAEGSCAAGGEAQAGNKRPRKSERIARAGRVRSAEASDDEGAMIPREVPQAPPQCAAKETAGPLDQAQTIVTALVWAFKHVIKKVMRERNGVFTSHVRAASPYARCRRGLLFAAPYRPRASRASRARQPCRILLPVVLCLRSVIPILFRPQLIPFQVLPALHFLPAAGGGYADRAQRPGVCELQKHKRGAHRRRRQAPCPGKCTGGVALPNKPKPKPQPPQALGPPLLRGPRRPAPIDPRRWGRCGRRLVGRMPPALALALNSQAGT